MSRWSSGISGVSSLIFGSDKGLSPPSSTATLNGSTPCYDVKTLPGNVQGSSSFTVGPIASSSRTTLEDLDGKDITTIRAAHGSNRRRSSVENLPIRTAATRGDVAKVKTIIDELGRQETSMEVEEPYPTPSHGPKDQLGNAHTQTSDQPSRDQKKEVVVTQMAGSVLSGALDAAICGTALAYSAYRLWKHTPGSDEDVEALVQARSAAAIAAAAPPATIAHSYQKSERTHENQGSIVEQLHGPHVNGKEAEMVLPEATTTEEDPPPYIEYPTLTSQNTVHHATGASLHKILSPMDQNVTSSAYRSKSNRPRHRRRERGNGETPLLASVASEMEESDEDNLNQNDANDNDGDSANEDEEMKAISERLQNLIDLGNEALMSTPVMSQEEWEEEEGREEETKKKKTTQAAEEKKEEAEERENESYEQEGRVARAGGGGGEEGSMVTESKRQLPSPSSILHSPKRLSVAGNNSVLSRIPVAIASPQRSPHSSTFPSPEKKTVDHTDYNRIRHHYRRHYYGRHSISGPLGGVIMTPPSGRVSPCRERPLHSEVSLKQNAAQDDSSLHQQRPFPLGGSTIGSSASSPNSSVNITSTGIPVYQHRHRRTLSLASFNSTPSSRSGGFKEFIPPGQMEQVSQGSDLHLLKAALERATSGFDLTRQNWGEKELER